MKVGEFYLAWAAVEDFGTEWGPGELVFEHHDDALIDWGVEVIFHFTTFVSG